MKVAKLFVLSFIVAFAITPMVYSSHSEVHVHKIYAQPLLVCFHPFHPSTWCMSKARRRVLHDLRLHLLEHVQSGDLGAVKTLLTTQVKEVVEALPGETPTAVMFKSPVKIEYFDAILPAAIKEAIEQGLSDVVRVLCSHAALNSRDTARHIKAAHDREGVAKKLYMSAAEGVATAVDKTKKATHKAAARVKQAYKESVK